MGLKSHLKFTKIIETWLCTKKSAEEILGGAEEPSG